MSRNVTLAPGEYYHVYNRGTEKRDIFIDAADYSRFRTQLYLSNSLTPVHIDTLGERQGRNLFELDRGESIIDVAAYCLMPNHFHLLIREKEEGGISRFMQKLLTGYTMYFNRRHERTGALFQGKYRATHVAEDRYLKYLIAYIHLNPIKLIEPKWKEDGIRDTGRAKQYLFKYPYSSYIDYLNHPREISGIINKDALPEYFQTSQDFESSVTEWLSFKADGDL